MDTLLNKARERGQRALSEHDSKKIIAGLGIPVTREELCCTRDEALAAASRIGFPVACKGCGAEATHKTELGIVRLGLGSIDAVGRAWDEIMASGARLDGVLVQEMVAGDRQLVMGLMRDPQFGPCVMFGVGGVFTEVIRDVSFRVAPLTVSDAHEMIDEIRMKKLLGEFRGSPPVDRDILAGALVALGDLGLAREDIAEIDVNPLVVCGGRPVAVDALVVLATA